MNINFEDNNKMKEAYEAVCNSDRHLFITGKAGTGKTTLLHYLREHCGKNIATVAPTGIAAIQAGGTTIHSQFGIPFGPFVPNIVDGRTYPGMQKYKLRPDKIEVLKSIDTLIIDEVSMVRADLIDAINDVLCLHRRCNHKMFGGVQVVMFGDLYQLSPVVKRDEEDILKSYYRTPYFFDAWSLKESGFDMVELDKIYRQSDPVFIDLLNEVRSGYISDNNYELLKQRHDPKFKSSEHMITVCSHNSKADKINTRELNRLDAQEYLFACQIEGDFSDRMMPCEQNLKLKEGAQVMFIVNHPQGKYVNGTVGHVSYIRYNNEAKQYDICVKLEGGGEVNVRPHTWDNYQYTLNKDSGKVMRESVGKCSQIPLRLAWAITIHKSQGMTFDKAAIDAGSSFAEGQIYVALSRCRTLDNLHLVSMFTKHQIRCDRDIMRFMRQKRAENMHQEEEAVEENIEETEAHEG